VRRLSGAAAVLAIALAGCGKGGSAGDCESACAHVLTLAHQDLERSLAELPDSMADMRADLRAQAEGSRDSDLASCKRQCADGKLDTACAKRARELDGAMRCTDRRGGKK
jgi:hypothetical protein